MADKSAETSTAPSEEESKTRPTSLSSTLSETAVKEEQAKKVSAGLMDPPVRAVHAVQAHVIIIVYCALCGNNG